jgi:hypothetical protein
MWRNVLRKIGTVSLGFVLWMGCVGQLAAVPLLPVELAMVAGQDAIIDYDFYGLKDISVAFSTPASVPYASATDSAGWSGNLVGSYLGEALSVSYSGAAGAYPAGPISWTSGGFFGAAPWSGGGTLSYSGAAPSFTIVMVDNFSIGANSVTLNILLAGTMTGSSIALDTVSGSESVNGVPLLAPHLALTMGPFDAVAAVASDLDYVRGGKVLDPGVVTPTPTGYNESVTLIVAAEPPGIAILGSSFLAMALGMGCRWVRRPSRYSLNRWNSVSSDIAKSHQLGEQRLRLFSNRRYCCIGPHVLASE